MRHTIHRHLTALQKLDFFGRSPTSRRLKLLLSLALLAVVGLGTWAVEQALAGPTPAPVAQTSPIHPAFAVLDADGENVLDSGAAVSLSQTCGACHDTAFIEEHSFHADLGLSSMTEPGQAGTGTPWDISTGLFGQFDPLTYRYLTPAGDERLDLSTAGWLQVMGPRVSGGGPATTARSGQPLLSGRSQRPRGQHSRPNQRPGSGLGLDRIGRDGAELPAVPHPRPQQRGPHRAPAGRASSATRSRPRCWALASSKPRTAAGPGIGRPSTQDGQLKPDFVRIQDPTNQNCAQCHGVVHEGSEPLLLDACDLSQPQTATTGQVISGQKINASGLNLADKNSLTYAWDIHAERGLQLHRLPLLAQQPGALPGDARTTS